MTSVHFNEANMESSPCYQAAVKEVAMDVEAIEFRIKAMDCFENIERSEELNGFPTPLYVIEKIKEFVQLQSPSNRVH